MYSLCLSYTPQSAVQIFPLVFPLIRQLPLEYINTLRCENPKKCRSVLLVPPYAGFYDTPYSMSCAVNASNTDPFAKTVCPHTCPYTGRYIGLCTYLSMHMSTCTCLHTCMCTCLYSCLHGCINTMDRPMRKSAHVSGNITYAHTYVNTYVYTHVNKCVYRHVAEQLHQAVLGSMI